MSIKIPIYFLFVQEHVQYRFLIVQKRPGIAILREANVPPQGVPMEVSRASARAASVFQNFSDRPKNFLVPKSKTRQLERRDHLILPIHPISWQLYVLEFLYISYLSRSMSRMYSNCPETSRICGSLCSPPPAATILKKFSSPVPKKLFGSKIENERTRE